METEGEPDEAVVDDNDVRRDRSISAVKRIVGLMVAVVLVIVAQRDLWRRPAGDDGTDGQDGEDGADGQDGEDGFDGQDGADGADGTPGGLSGLERVTGTAFGAVAEGETISATAVCPAGKSVTGGGFTTSDPRLRIFESATTVAVAQWTVNWVATVDVPNAVVVAEAICAHSAP